MKKKICVVTGNRSEYALLYWVMKEIQDDKNLDLQLAVTGAHLAPEFGLTYKAIEDDGFVIDVKVDMFFSSDSPAGITKSIGSAVIGFADAFERLKPDIIVLLGDRYEALAASQAALVAGIPIAHLHGGEASEGAIDEAIRHSITKMSYWHFVAAEEYKRRVIQLGEDPARIFNVGALGVDNIKRSVLMNKQEFEAHFGYVFQSKNFLVTYHPATLDKNDPERSLAELFRALDGFPEAGIIFTQSNADTHGRRLNELIREYVKARSPRVTYIPSLGRIGYVSAMKYVDVVVGNSSSGIAEAPSLGKATVNVGDRQRGRLKADSIINCEETEEAIYLALRKALSAEFQLSLNDIVSPYGDGNAARQIKEKLARLELPANIMKEFYNVMGVMEVSSS